MADMKRGTDSSRVRLILTALILVLGAFWVGARYGPTPGAKRGSSPRRGEPERLSSDNFG